MVGRTGDASPVSPAVAAPLPVVWGKIRQNTSSFWKWFCAVAAEELRVVS